MGESPPYRRHKAIPIKIIADEAVPVALEFQLLRDAGKARADGSALLRTLIAGEHGIGIRNQQVCDLDIGIMTLPRRGSDYDMSAAILQNDIADLADLIRTGQ